MRTRPPKSLALLALAATALLCGACCHPSSTCASPGAWLVDVCIDLPSDGAGKEFIPLVHFDQIGDASAVVGYRGAVDPDLPRSIPGETSNLPLVLRRRLVHGPSWWQWRRQVGTRTENADKTGFRRRGALRFRQVGTARTIEFEWTHGWPSSYRVIPNSEDACRPVEELVIHFAALERKDQSGF